MSLDYLMQGSEAADQVQTRPLRVPRHICEICRWFPIDGKYHVAFS